MGPFPGLCPLSLRERTTIHHHFVIIFLFTKEMGKCLWYGSDLLRQSISFNLPRAGFRYYWKAPDMYKLFGLTTYRGIPSKWAFDSASRWRKYIDKVDDSNDHILESRLGAQGATCLQRNRPLVDAMSFSTLGILVMLCRWAFAASRHGGLPQEQKLWLPESSLNASCVPA